MKHLLLIILCTAMLLSASCEFTAPSPHEETALDPDPSITMRTMYPVYNGDCTWVSVIIENNSEESIIFGDSWTLERLSGDDWVAILPDEDTYFNSIAYSVESGGYSFANCYLPTYTDAPKDGRYRIVKRIDNEHYYTAEFEIGESKITEEAPHGFTPLEKLPEDYSKEQMIADGVVVNDYDGIENADKLTEFLRSANHYRFRGQLRIARPTYEGDMIINDIIIEKQGRIDYYRDTTRDAWDIGEITKTYFSHIVAGDNNIWLTNHGEYGAYDENVPLISWVDPPTEAVEAVMSYTYWDPIVLDVWSPNGDIRVSPGSRHGLAINTDGWGTSYGGNDGAFLEREILDLIWQDDTTLLVKCKADDGMYYYEFVHIDEADSDSIRTLSYTTSAHAPMWSGDKITIPE